MFAVIKAKLSNFEPAGFEPFLTDLKTRVAHRALAIVAYGSCLSSVTVSRTSTPDFYVIVDSYRKFHAGWLHAALNWFLPPNIYHFSVDGQVAKYNVLSLRDLIRQTTPSTPDCYNLGRLSKRIALVWSASPEFLEIVACAQVTAMQTIAWRTYFMVPRSFTSDEFCKQALRISYAADVRVEAMDKVERLFNAEADFYRSAYSWILERAVESGLLTSTDAGKTYLKPKRPFSDGVGMLRLRWFLFRSQIRSLLRWPKGILTVEHWIDYLLAKVERTQGIKLPITDRERKYWYVFGWKYLFQLRRKKLLK